MNIRNKSVTVSKNILALHERGVSIVSPDEEKIFNALEELISWNAAKRFGINLFKLGVSRDIVQKAFGLSDREIDDIHKRFIFEETFFH